MEVLENINIKNFVEVIESEKNVIVWFYSDNDKISINTMNSLSSLNETDFQLIKLDINKEPNIAMNFTIKAIPSIIVFKDWSPEEHIIWKEDIEKYINILKLS